MYLINNLFLGSDVMSSKANDNNNNNYYFEFDDVIKNNKIFNFIKKQKSRID